MWCMRQGLDKKAEALGLNAKRHAVRSWLWRASSILSPHLSLSSSINQMQWEFISKWYSSLATQRVVHQPAAMTSSKCSLEMQNLVKMPITKKRDAASQVPPEESESVFKQDLWGICEQFTEVSSSSKMQWFHSHLNSITLQEKEGK